MVEPDPLDWLLAPVSPPESAGIRSFRVSLAHNWRTAAQRMRFGGHDPGTAISLPPLLAQGLDVVFVGTEPGHESVRLGRYYANRDTAESVDWDGRL
jgi:hypothetical protein